MILYSVLPYEAFDESYYTVPQTSRFFRYQYGLLETKPSDKNSFDVVNIISSNPKAYLDRNMPIGKRIKIK